MPDSSEEISEESPISEDEILYRRIPASHYSSDLNCPVLADGFRPSSLDEDGISFYRAKFTDPKSTLLSAREEKRGTYYVAKIKVKDIVSLSLPIKLTIIPDPCPPVKGHCLITEINKKDYDNKTNSTLKENIKEASRELAKLIKPEDVVHAPGNYP